MNFVKIKSYFLFILLLIVTASPAPGAEDKAAAVKKLHVRAGSELDYPPFCMVDSVGNAVGFSVDLLKAAAREMHLELDWSVGPWTEVFDMLVEGRIDVLPLVGRTAEREGVFDFTFPYYTMRGGVFVQRSNSEIHSLEDLYPKKIAVMASDNAHEYLKRSGLFNDIHTTETFAEAFELLSRGQVDAVVAQKVMGMQLLRTLMIDNVKLLDLTLPGFTQNFCFAVTEGNDVLLSQLNDGLALVISSGEYDTIQKTWFAPLQKHLLSWRDILENYGIEILFSIVLVLILLVFVMRAIINRRTADLKKDIAKRIIIENELKLEKENTEKSEKHLQDLLSNLSVGVTIYVYDKGMVYCNERAAELLGLSEGQLLGKSAVPASWKFLREDLSEMPPEEYPINRLWRTGKKYNNYVVALQSRGNDQIRWLLVNGYTARYSENEAEQAIISFMDITDLKNTQRALEDTLRDLRESQRIAHVGSWRMNIATNEVEWTEELYKMYGFDAAKPPPSYTEHMKLFTPASWDLLSRSLENTVKTGEPYELELEMVREGRENGWIWVRGERLCDASGNPVSLWGAAQDISDRKLAEIEKDQLQGQLRQSQKLEAIGKLAGGIAHDFNNILAALYGFTDLAFKNIHSVSRLGEILGNIQTAHKKAASLVRQILAFSRRDLSDPRKVEINELLKNLKQMVLRLVDEDVHIHFDLIPEPVHILADPNQVEQILINLIVNARDSLVEHTGNTGRKSINIKNGLLNLTEGDNRYPSYMKPGHYLTIEVADNGMGISDEHISMIFEPFFTTKPPGKGSGLGLSTVYGIIKQNMGHITVSTMVGKGTVFTVYWPLYEGGTVEQTSAQADETDLSFFDGKIVLVEDDDKVRSVTEELLAAVGYHVRSYGDGSEALKNLEGKSLDFDLLITDMVMPELGGADLAKRLLEKKPDLKIIFITGYTSEHSFSDEIKARKFPILQKPFNNSVLLKLIRETLE